jgi:hypothetical protein
MGTDKWDDERLKRVSKDPDAHWVEAPLPAAVSIHRDPLVPGSEHDEPLTPTRMIAFRGDLFLVEHLGEPDDWYMGMKENGVIRCWGKYGTLWDAILGL